MMTSHMAGDQTLHMAGDQTSTHGWGPDITHGWGPDITYGWGLDITLYFIFSKATPTDPSWTTPTEGPSNAVAIQLFCLDEQYEMR